MRLLKCISALILCGTLLAMAPAWGEPQNACAPFYDPARREPHAEDVFVSVETLDAETFEYEAGCFLVPRVAIDRKLRSSYVDGKPYVTMLFFEPNDLFDYIKHKQSILVGSEERIVRADDLDCLVQPAPDWAAIVSRTVAAPPTVKEISAYAKEVDTDMPGYRRYHTEIADYYLVDAHADPQVSFWCRRRVDQDICNLVGPYGDFSVVATYLKAEMMNVQPETTLECVRTIADLFKLK